MKRYKAIQLNDGSWAVKHGKSCKGMHTLSHKGSDKATAEQVAAKYQADAYILALRELIPQMSLTDAYSVGHEANRAIDLVENRGRDEDPDFQECDPRGFLA